MLTPQELKFITSEELIEIEPCSNINTLSLIHNTYTNIKPLSIIKVPLYIALELKKGNLAYLRIPACYTYQYLNNLIDEEINNQHEYISIPKNIFCTGKLVIRESYNSERKEECIGLIDKLKEIRFKKTLTGLSKMEGRALTLNNLTMFEWYEIREILIKPMEERRKIIEKYSKV